MKKFLIIYFLFFAINANSQIFGSDMYNNVKDFIDSKPEIINNIKKSYIVDSYGKCIAVVGSFEADIIRGYVKPTDPMFFNLPVDHIALSIARKEFLRKGLSEVKLAESAKFYTSQFKQKDKQDSMILECRNIASIFLG